MNKLSNLRIEQYVTFRNVLIFGLILSFFVTLSQVLRDSDSNFKIFYYSTQDFWNNVSPYGEYWKTRSLDYFLYGPPFSVLFSPLAVLPRWLSAFVWNLSSFAVLGLSIYSLPRITKLQKAFVLLYILPLIGPSQLSFQYNILILALFLSAFSLLENDKGKWAVLLIMISACTKVYGGFELLLLFLYPKFWKNVGWSVLFGVLLLLLPVIKLGFAGLWPYYQEWVSALTAHKGSRAWETFFDIKFIWGATHPSYQPYIQVAILGLVLVLTLWRLKWRQYISFRSGVLAIIMGYVILFSNSSEKHTYVISLCAFCYWYFIRTDKKVFDKVIFWSVFVVMGLVPIDLICPKDVMVYLYDTLDLNKILYTFVWIYIVIRVYFCNQSNVECGSREYLNK